MGGSKEPQEEGRNPEETEHLDMKTRCSGFEIWKAQLSGALQRFVRRALGANRRATILGNQQCPVGVPVTLFVARRIADVPFTPLGEAAIFWAVHLVRACTLVKSPIRMITIFASVCDLYPNEAESCPDAGTTRGGTQ